MAMMLRMQENKQTNLKYLKHFYLIIALLLFFDNTKGRLFYKDFMVRNGRCAFKLSFIHSYSLHFKKHINILLKCKWQAGCDGAISNKLHAIYPQLGSILGPIIFNIFLIDIFASSNETTTHLQMKQLRR